ncbi:hypothetical protein I552_2630 [Mycobacterium xenopi 3993]|nr:hypothetical protein I552_2630 [Mycobacterium xenopi 3993]
MPEKSGSPASLAPWDTLGFQGRNFVATGPHAAELTRLNGRPAKEPIRVYAGLQTAADDRARAQIIVDELERTHAFDRKLLVIIPTTGTGWIDPVAARSLEMMYNGDTAMAGLQYSYLPSWISFLADRQKSMDSGRCSSTPSTTVGGSCRRITDRNWCFTAKAWVRWPGRRRSGSCPTSPRWASTRCCGWGRRTKARCGMR